VKTFAASLGALVIAASVLVAGAPASAAQNVFVNPAATPQANDLDISAVEIDYTADRFEFTALTQNFSAAAGYSFSVYITPTQQPLSAQPYYFTFTSVVSGNSMVVYEYFTQGATTTGPFTVGNAFTSVNNTDKTVLLSIPPLGIFENTTLFSWATLSDNVVAVNAGIPAVGGTLGFGPINITTMTTSAELLLSSPTQVYGSNPSVVTASVGPSSARGTISVLDGAKVIASADFVGSDVAFNLPKTLAYGNHSLTAVFSPTNPVLYTSATSSAVPFAVLSPGTKTSTKLTLSKSTQHYKKKSAVVTVKVSHKPSGKVVLYDGTKKLKTLTLKKGAASYKVSAKLAKGKHKLSAVFVPKKPLSYAPSTSKTRTLKVVK
jgi:5'-nucleotidase